LYVYKYVCVASLFDSTPAQEKRERRKEREEKEGKKKVQPPKNKAHSPIPKRTRHTHRRRSRERTDNKDFFIEKEKNTERYEKQKAQARAPGALRAGRL
jgi:hypothetical protein